MREDSKTRLEEDVRAFCDKLKSVIENGKEIEVLVHLDADGIASGSILATALARIGARYGVRAISGMNNIVIESMVNEDHDFYIIADLGGSWASMLKKALGCKWTIIDHHQISEEEILTDDSKQILNAWKYGIDGDTEVSAAGMAYLVASTLNPKNRDLSAISVVSAVADRQDIGAKKSFIGLNVEILKTAQALELVSVEEDLLLAGRETRPVHEALAHTYFPYIEGLTWNSGNCYALIKDAGIKLKNNNDGRWRVLAELTPEEKSEVLNAINKFVVRSSKSSANCLGELTGLTYTFKTEDKYSHLRDAREFSAMLNACGRIGKAGIGISICMGDRNEMLNAGEQIVETYKNTLRSYVSIIFADKWRITDDGKIVFVNGDGIVTEDMLGALSSLLSGTISLTGRLLFIRTLAADGNYKFSSRKCLGCNSKTNLGLVMRHLAETFHGIGGGHSAAAGSTIPAHALEDFIANIRSIANDPKFATLS